MRRPRALSAPVGRGEAVGAYWPRPWTCEDGGPRRWGAVSGQPGLGLGSDDRLEVAAVHQAFATDALVRRDPGELYALRHDIPRGGPQAGPVEAWVERLHPETLEVTASTPRLPGGRFWPGGIAAHASGDLHSIFGRWAHRLSPDLEVLAAQELPVDRPYNSFVVLDTGELVTKDCDAPNGQAPSTFSVLDPTSLEPVSEPLRMPEALVGRLSSDGKSVLAIGATTMYRLRFDPKTGLAIDERWRPRYGPAPGRTFGWDPVITEEHVFWMDNGQNEVDQTMLGSGTGKSPLRLWWARLDDGATRSVEISGIPYGTESNPPGWDPKGRQVIAYDSGNAVVRAWRLDGDELAPRWRVDGLAHAGHLILFPDTRELVVGDWNGPALMRRRPIRSVARVLASLVVDRPRFRNALARGSDHLVVLDLDTGVEKARVEVPSFMQGFLFPAPGFDRDVYYQSLSTIARVRVA